MGVVVDADKECQNVTNHLKSLFLIVVLVFIIYSNALSGSSLTISSPTATRNSIF